jgi:hypothetical protein
VTNAGSISEVIAGRAAFALTFRDCLDRGFGLPAMRDKVFDHLIADPRRRRPSGRRLARRAHRPRA